MWLSYRTGNFIFSPFSALVDSRQYVLTSHVMSVTPSGTVFDILKHRQKRAANDGLPYVGDLAPGHQRPAAEPARNGYPCRSGPESRS